MAPNLGIPLSDHIVLMIQQNVGIASFLWLNLCFCLFFCKQLPDAGDLGAMYEKHNSLQGQQWNHFKCSCIESMKCEIIISFD